MFDSQLYHRSFQKKALQQCTPWKFLSLLPHALLPNTAALTSLIGFTVTKWQAAPKLIKCQSQLQTCSDGPLTFQIPVYIDSINLILQIDMRCFFWFQKLKLLQVCMTQRNFAVFQSITKKGRLDKPNLFSSE